MKGHEGIYYDERYQRGYRAELSGYEKARHRALHHFIRRVARVKQVQTMLDYGSGSGLFLDLWKELFPAAALCCTDISGVALKQLEGKYAHYNVICGLVKDGQAPFADGMFDLVVSVEVMEHVGDLDAFLADIHRLLKPGGYFIWTTPCANALSIEHIYSLLSGKIEKTVEGYRRWQWEEKTHVRRLKSREARDIVTRAGFDPVDFRFRAHFFSFICTYILARLSRGRLKSACEKLMFLDYALFRRLPNGASMIGGAVKS